MKNTVKRFDLQFILVQINNHSDGQTKKGKRFGNLTIINFYNLLTLKLDSQTVNEKSGEKMGESVESTESRFD